MRLKISIILAALAFPLVSMSAMPEFTAYGDGAASIDYKNSEIYGVRYNPTRKDVWSGCSGPATEILKVHKVSPEPTNVEVMYTYNNKKVPYKFYMTQINDTFPNVVRQYLPMLFTEGNTLSITYMTCGSGGFKTITQALLISK